MERINIFWFRRDLRLEDNAGLFHALSEGIPVLPIFIFDQHILDDLEDKSDNRVDYIHQALTFLNTKLKHYNSSIYSKFGSPKDVLKELGEKYTINAIYANEDYESYGINRDNEIASEFDLRLFKDHVVFRYDEILKKDQTPYTVYTPYSKQWKAKLADEHLVEYKPNYSKFLEQEFELPTLDSIGFQRTSIEFQAPSIPLDTLLNYEDVRNLPSLDATTKLSLPHRFGTISIRECVRKALSIQADVWLNELIWREFFMQILAHFPESAYSCFKPKYEVIQWRNHPEEFELWCKGETGYPIVDAGIKELNETGFMHNRVRMIVASFLCKHLLIDWRWGESYFATKLNDYEMASNVGNWQWASSTGCDSTPYFRVFNPTLQQQKFDPKFEYIKRWIPSFDPENYITPIVPHDFARQRAISTYKEGLNSF